MEFVGVVSLLGKGLLSARAAQLQKIVKSTRYSNGLEEMGARKVHPDIPRLLPFDEFDTGTTKFVVQCQTEQSPTRMFRSGLSSFSSTNFSLLQHGTPSIVTRWNIQEMCLSERSAMLQLSERIVLPLSSVELSSGAEGAELEDHRRDQTKTQKCE